MTKALGQAELLRRCQNLTETDIYGLFFMLLVGKRKMLCKSCEHHNKTTPCYEVIILGLCLKEECSLYHRVKQFFPKLKKYNQFVARGVIPHTVWDFSEKGMAKQEKAIAKAKKWLERYSSVELT